MGRKFYIDKNGYPRYSDTSELVHRKVASKKVGGPIYRDRVVHHKDGNKKNFRRKNLQIMEKSAHSKLEAKKRKRKKKKT
ncbi:MAG: HNH endonuclease [Candidatus Helarchaeota archaeon]